MILKRSLFLNFFKHLNLFVLTGAPVGSICTTDLVRKQKYLFFLPFFSFVHKLNSTLKYSHLHSGMYRFFFLSVLNLEEHRRKWVLINGTQSFLTLTKTPM